MLLFTSTFKLAPFQINTNTPLGGAVVEDSWESCRTTAAAPPVTSRPLVCKELDPLLFTFAPLAQEAIPGTVQEGDESQPPGQAFSIQHEAVEQSQEGSFRTSSMYFSELAQLPHPRIANGSTIALSVSCAKLATASRPRGKVKQGTPNVHQRRMSVRKTQRDTPQAPDCNAFRLNTCCRHVWLCTFACGASIT